MRRFRLQPETERNAPVLTLQAVRALRRKVRHFGSVRCTGNGAICTATCVRTYHVSQPEMQCTFMCVAFLASALSSSAPACSFFQGHPVSFCTSRKKWGGFLCSAMRDAVPTPPSSVTFGDSFPRRGKPFFAARRRRSSRRNPAQRVRRDKEERGSGDGDGARSAFTSSVHPSAL